MASSATSSSFSFGNSRNMDSLNQHIVHAGWLIKSPPEKRIWKTKWRRRWFVLKLSGQIPGQYVLEYYTDSTCKKLKGQIDLDQCEQVDAGLQLEIRKQNYDNMFDLRTSKRTYYLVAGSEEEMNKWVECICAVCGLKMEAIQNELALLPSLEMTNDERYSPQPSQSEQHQQQSTSESSLSTLNYIPISECYTGKPHHSPPPPRPPKPPTLKYAKSQSSLVLWPQQQDQQVAKPTLPVQHPIISTSNLPPKSFPTTNLNDKYPQISDTNYLNNNSNSISSIKTNQPYNFYDTWHSRSKRPDFLIPPQVNRDLKPNRRRVFDHQQNNHHIQTRSESQINPMVKQPFKRSNISQPLMNNRHTLPRPLITSYTLRNQNKSNFNNDNNNNSNYCHLAHFEQTKNLEDFERQYLDLDLDSESTNNNNNSASSSPGISNSNNPDNATSSTEQTTNLNSNWNIPSNKNSQAVRHPTNTMTATNVAHTDLLNNNNLLPTNCDSRSNNDSHSQTTTAGLTSAIVSHITGTVYKKVDFVKTKALNDMRLNVNMYRNAN